MKTEIKLNNPQKIIKAKVTYGCCYESNRQGKPCPIHGRNHVKGEKEAMPDYPTLSDLMSVDINYELGQDGKQWFLTKESAQKILDILKCFDYWKKKEDGQPKPCNHIFQQIGNGMCQCLRCKISGVLEGQPKANIHNLYFAPSKC